MRRELTALLDLKIKTPSGELVHWMAPGQVRLQPPGLAVTPTWNRLPSSLRVTCPIITVPGSASA